MILWGHLYKLIFTLLCLLSANLVWAGCSCVTYESYDLVFEGKVIKQQAMESGGETNLPPSESLRFKVEALMTGQAKKTVTVMNSGSCPFEFAKGSYYFVFAKKAEHDGKEVFFTASCFGNEEI